MCFWQDQPRATSQSSSPPPPDWRARGAGGRGPPAHGRPPAGGTMPSCYFFAFAPGRGRSNLHAD
eukprot:9089592-Pyramimonas_sp.AAC.1